MGERIMWGKPNIDVGDKIQQTYLASPEPSEVSTK
jgi:hypothetical protein